MRKNEGDEVEAAFKDSGMHFIRVDAEKRFLDKLAGLKIQKQNVKLSAKSSSAYLKTKAVKLVPLTS